MPEPEAKTDSADISQEKNDSEDISQQKNDSSDISQDQKDFSDEWMFQSCDMYKSEYDDCRSIAARFHQYFVHGKIHDCSQWKVDYHNCYLWQKYKTRKAYEDLVKSERARRFQRLKGHYENDIWKPREKPPENWNAPLPKWMEERFENSYLKYQSDLEKEGKSDVQSSSCTIL